MMREYIKVNPEFIESLIIEMNQNEKNVVKYVYSYKESNHFWDLLAGSLNTVLNERLNQIVEENTDA